MSTDLPETPAPTNYANLIARFLSWTRMRDDLRAALTVEPNATA